MIFIFFFTSLHYYHDSQGHQHQRAHQHQRQSQQRQRVDNCVFVRNIQYGKSGQDLGPLFKGCIKAAVGGVDGEATRRGTGFLIFQSSVYREAAMYDADRNKYFGRKLEFSISSTCLVDLKYHEFDRVGESHHHFDGARPTDHERADE